MQEIEDRYKTVLDNLYDGAYFVDKDRKIVYWNRAAERITGFSDQDVLGKNCACNILTHIDKEGNKLCQGMCPLAESMSQGKPNESDLYLHHKKGHRVKVSVRTLPFKNKDDTVIGGLELFAESGVKEAMQSRLEELEALALLDPLTQLANRRYLEQECQNRLEELQRYDRPFGILLLDIDHFKIVNDTHGHDIGDEILKVVANTMVNNSRPFDLFGRWGGEEFIGIIRNVEKEALAAIGNRMRILIENAYIMLNEKPFHVTVSLGATTSKKHDTMEAIIKRADQLLYQSKAEGRNRMNVD